MKKLILVRHGKAEDFALTDFERPLREKGIQQAQRRGLEFLQANIHPVRVISSDALRTKETTLHVLSGLNMNEQRVAWEHSLYNASSSAILAQIMRVEDQVECLMVVGHNNGISELATFFNAHYVSLKPSEYALFEFNTNEWSGILEAPIMRRYVHAD